MTANGERFRVPRTMRTSLALVVLLLLLPLATSQAAASSTGQWRIPGPTTKLYIGQSARLTAQIPSFWTVNAANDYDYSGSDGFVYSAPLSAASLEDACDQAARSPYLASARTTEQMTVQRGSPACVITAPASPSRDVRASSAIVLPHPHPFTSFHTTYAYALLVTDPAHFPSILASMSFAPDRVTPYAYVMSAIDVIEARSLFSDRIDWSAERQMAAEIITDWDSAHVVIQNLVFELRGWGDNHSNWLSPEFVHDDYLRRSGFGLFVVGNTVLQVNRGGPAAQAGILADDRILTVDGGTMFGPGAPQDLDIRFPTARSMTLTLLRPRTGQRLTVTLERQQHDAFLPPTGRRLGNNTGYIELFSSVGLESNGDYAKSAQSIIAKIEQSPTCGWVVDLRSNYGGSMSPMLLGLAPLIGNGRLFGFISADGHEDWHSMKDGALYQDGVEYAPATASDTPASLARVPVAVLIGPSTGSAAEVATLAFIGRDHTRLFGSPSAGLTSGIASFALFDGYTLALATVWEMDRTGKVYKSSIEPDQQVLTSAQTWGTDKDAVINAATVWLSQQPACRATNAQATPAP